MVGGYLVDSGIVSVRLIKKIAQTSVLIIVLQL